MQMQSNPYETVPDNPRPAEGEGVEMTSVAMSTLFKTKISIFIVGVILIASSLITSGFSIIVLLSSGVFEALAATVVTLVLAIVYISLAAKLLKYKNAIEQLKKTKDEGDLTRVARATSEVWTFLGASYIFIIILNVILAIVKAGIS